MTNWQTKKLGDVMDFVPTGAHSRNDMTIATDNPNQVFNIHYGDIHTKYFTYLNLDKDIVPTLKENTVRDNMRLQDGDLVVADASEDYDGVGSSVELRNVRNRKVIGGLHTFALRSKNDEFAPGFTGLMLKNPATHKRLMQMSVYSKVYGLTKSSIASVDVSYPEKPEQKRIVGVLEVWDEYIEKLEQKIALKEQLKKGLMQQLLTGKRRLPEFGDDWKGVRLGDIAKMQSGGTPSSKNDKFYGDDVIWVSIADMTSSGKYLSDSQRKLSKLGYDSSTARIYPANTVLYAMYASIGECVIASVPLSSSQAILGIQPSEKLDYEYLYYYLTSKKDEVKLLGQQGTQSNLNAGIVKDFKLKLPSTEEQKKIATILSKSDEETELLKKQINIIKSQKKYLLKNLITGTIRTPEDLQPLDTSRLERSAL